MRVLAVLLAYFLVAAGILLVDQQLRLEQTERMLIDVAQSSNNAWVAFVNEWNRR